MTIVNSNRSCRIKMEDTVYQINKIQMTDKVEKEMKVEVVLVEISIK